MSPQETTEFFERYRDSFNRLDGDAVADLWHVPASITDSNADGGAMRVTAYTEDAPMRANMHALCDVYRRNGFERADFEIVNHVPLGAQHAFALLHWTLRRADGSALQSFHTGYQIGRSGAGVKALMAVAFQENIAEMTPHAAQ
jgi:hypothetical protein